MSTIYTSNEDMKKVRELGLNVAKGLYEYFYGCGSFRLAEDKLMTAYMIGYEAGKKAEREGKHKGEEK